ncbi:MAG: hypothetical protein ABH827_06110 [bacterium]
MKTIAKILLGVVLMSCVVFSVQATKRYGKFVEPKTCVEVAIEKICMILQEFKEFPERIARITQDLELCMGKLKKEKEYDLLNWSCCYMTSEFVAKFTSEQVYECFFKAIKLLKIDVKSLKEIKNTAQENNYEQVSNFFKEYIIKN